MPAERNNYQLIQYIQIISEEQNADAALAEIEVIGIGDNIAIGTSQRGNFVEGDGTGSTFNLFDANLNTNNTVTGCRGELSEWAEGGTWFRADLGATFFIDEMFLYSMRPDEGTLGFTISGTGPGHTILFSDGTPATGTAPIVEVPENVDYEEVFTHLAPTPTTCFICATFLSHTRLATCCGTELAAGDGASSSGGSYNYSLRVIQPKSSCSRPLSISAR